MSPQLRTKYKLQIKGSEKYVHINIGYYKPFHSALNSVMINLFHTVNIVQNTGVRQIYVVLFI